MPYHLCHFEVPTSVARAVLFEDATIAPVGAPTVEVVTTAKQDLSAGTVLDGLGGYDTYGQAESADHRGPAPAPDRRRRGRSATRDLPRDQVLRYADVELPAGRLSTTAGRTGGRVADTGDRRSMMRALLYADLSAMSEGDRSARSGCCCACWCMRGGGPWCCSDWRSSACAFRDQAARSLARGSRAGVLRCRTQAGQHDWSGTCAQAHHRPGHRRPTRPAVATSRCTRTSLWATGTHSAVSRRSGTT